MNLAEHGFKFLLSLRRNDKLHAALSRYRHQIIKKYPYWYIFISFSIVLLNNKSLKLLHYKTYHIVLFYKVLYSCLYN